METRSEIARQILQEFLDRWPVEKIRSMNLSEYVSIANPDTFCQWIETKTKPLGSIKGVPSIKFGIYKRGTNGKIQKVHHNDEEYSWQKYFGNTRKSAFENVIKEVLQIIEFSKLGKWNEIDNLHLSNFFKWKIAYLYSNERLIPIFSTETLLKIASSFGLRATARTSVSTFQQLMIDHKPAHLTIYEYAEELFQKFGRQKQNNEKRQLLTKRIANNTKSTSPQFRKGASSYIAEQKHNLLQEKLKENLIRRYGEPNVKMEENYVDIKVTLPNKTMLYEVKSSSYASDCVREALGQLISYSFREGEILPKEHYIVGQFEPNKDEVNYINFVKKHLSLGFEYLAVNLD